MANLKLVDFQEAKTSKVFLFEETNIKELSGIIENLFLGEGYKREQGSPENAVYGIGNKTMRILFGAFVKRYTFNVIIKEENGQTKLELIKGMSGVSGGAIGIAKLNKEYKRIAEAIKNRAVA